MCSSPSTRPACARVWSPWRDLRLRSDGRRVVTPTTPGFSYRFDVESGALVRSSSLGPVFAERSDTVGEHHLDLGVSYLYARLTEFEGADFADQLTVAGVRTDPRTGVVFAQAF